MYTLPFVYTLPLNMTVNTAVLIGLLPYAAAILRTEVGTAVLLGPIQLLVITVITAGDTAAGGTNNAVGGNLNFFRRISRPNLFGSLQSPSGHSKYTPCFGLLQRIFGEPVTPSQSARAVAAHLPTSSVSAAQPRERFRESPRKK